MDALYQAELQGQHVYSGFFPFSSFSFSAGRIFLSAKKPRKAKLCEALKTQTRFQGKGDRACTRLSYRGNNNPKTTKSSIGMKRSKAF